MNTKYPAIISTIIFGQKIVHTHRGVMIDIFPSKPGWFLIIHVVELV